MAEQVRLRRQSSTQTSLHIIVLREKEPETDGEGEYSGGVSRWAGRDRDVNKQTTELLVMQPIRQQEAGR